MTMPSRHSFIGSVKMDDEDVVLYSSHNSKSIRPNGKELTDYGSVELLPSDESKNTVSTCLCYPSWLKDEFVVLFNLSWTMVLATVLTNLLAPIGLMFAGHLGVEELGGVALGNTILNIFGNAVGIGLSTACDTFFAQTFGSGNMKLMGVYLQRGCYIILLFAFPCWMILLNTETILVALGQEPIIANIAADYILHYMAVLPLIFLFHIFSKYLRNQNIIVPTLIAGGLGVGVTALAAYVFVNVLDLHVQGCAYAQIMGFSVFAGGCILYAIYSPECQQCWNGFSWDALQDWGTFTNLAIYGMLLVLEQIGAFEIGTLLAGLFGKVELGAQTIVFQIETITFMVPIGVGIACNIRIGHLLGANDPVQTKRSIYVGYLIIWSVAACVAVLLATLRYEIPRMFTDDDAVIEVAANLLLIMALYCVFEGTVGTSAGMMRGCGRQRQAAMIAFLGYFIVGLPIGIALMFETDLKSAGFWWGLTIGIVTEAFLYVSVISCTNWTKQATDAQIRAGLVRQMSKALAEQEDGDEEKGLLASGESARLRRSSSVLSETRRYVGEYDSSLPSIPVVTMNAAKLTKREMICRRGLVVLLCILMLVAGLLIRFMFPPAPVVYHNGTTLSPVTTDYY